MYFYKTITECVITSTITVYGRRDSYTRKKWEKIVTKASGIGFDQCYSLVLQLDLCNPQEL